MYVIYSHSRGFESQLEGFDSWPNQKQNRNSFWKKESTSTAKNVEILHKLQLTKYVLYKLKYFVKAALTTDYKLLQPC